MKKELIPDPIYRNTIYYYDKQNKFHETFISSSLALQKVMYFNIIFTSIFTYIFIFSSIYKIIIFRGTNIIVKLILIPFWLIIDIFKFLSGYNGNIKETVK